MRALVLGAGGMLGRDMVLQAPGNVEVVQRTHAEVDITEETDVRAALRDVRPAIVVNCCAYTDVDEAEAHRQEAFAVNGEGVGILGRAAESLHGSLVVHFSTDYVFNGRVSTPYLESALTDPLGAYGASKLAGEQALAKSRTRYLIIRTQWLFGVNGRSFPRTMWNRALQHQPTRVVSDQRGRPTYTVDLARAVWHLIHVAPTMARAGTLMNSIIHMANRGIATWHDVALHIFRSAGVPELLTACRTDDYPAKAARPASSVLDTRRFERLTGTPLAPWRDAIDRFLTQIRGAPQ